MSEGVEPEFDGIDDEAGVSGADDEIKAFEAAQKLEEDMKARDLRLLEDFQPIYDDLYRDYPYEYTVELSRKNRNRLGHIHNVNLSYSQASFPEMMKIMAHLKRLGLSDHAEGNFVDLGSGIGSMVFAAIMAHDFYSASGIEILDELHDTACKVYESWTKSMQSRSHKNDILVKFKHGDFCYMDWSHGDVVFCNATCLDTVVMGKLHTSARELKPGSFFIIVTKKLPDEALTWFQFLDTGSMVLNWGLAPVHFYRRNRMPSPTYIPNKADYVSAIIRRKALPVFDPSRAKLIQEDIAEEK